MQLWKKQILLNQGSRTEHIKIKKMAIVEKLAKEYQKERRALGTNKQEMQDLIDRYNKIK